MKDRQEEIAPSRTAQWVAAARSLGALLPRELLLAHDPYGIDFTHGRARGLADVLLRHPRIASALLRRAGPLTSFLLWMQLRTRALDDVLLEFVRGGGRQIVILGAGFDSRALRFREALRDAAVFEIDRPATQSRKIARLPVETMQNRVIYVAWDFENDSAALLPHRLRELGLDSGERVLTLWEGVTMYLSESAVDATVRAVRELGSPGSQLALTYIDRRAIARPRGEHGLLQRIVARAGEPWRFGWHPDEVRGWFAERTLELVSDVSDRELAERYLPQPERRRFARATRHIALLEVRSGG